MWLAAEPVADIGFASAAPSGAVADWVELLVEHDLVNAVGSQSPPPMSQFPLPDKRPIRPRGHPRGGCAARAPPA